ncbi:MAG: metallophosphoesterase [Litoreibacter sp.]
MTQVRNLGDISGDVVLFGGIYSNIQAFEAFLTEVRGMGFDLKNCICTGDIVAYGADPAAVCARMVETSIASIAGNCEQQLAQGEESCGCGFEDGTACDIASKSWYEYASKSVGDHIDYFAQLPDIMIFSAYDKRYAVIHGGVSDISRFVWPTSDVAVFQEEIFEIEKLTGPIDGVVCGHSGIPFERVIGEKVWINAGVLGMPPHDGRPLTRFAVLSADGVRFHRLSYDHSAAAEAMRQSGLVQGYEIALEAGIWPSEDVLPAELRR